MNGRTMVQNRVMMNQYLIENENKQLRLGAGRNKLTGVGVSLI